MASSSLTVLVGSREIRKYGGTRGDVKSLKYHYENMSYKEFKKRHPTVTEDEYNSSLELRMTLNKN